jgi:hypothetical protein
MERADQDGSRHGHDKGQVGNIRAFLGKHNVRLETVPKFPSRGWPFSCLCDNTRYAVSCWLRWVNDLTTGFAIVSFCGPVKEWKEQSHSKILAVQDARHDGSITPVNVFASDWIRKYETLA